MSIRKQIINAVVSRLSIIRTATGFQTDIGKNVFLCKPAISEDDLPAVIVFPGTESVEETYTSHVRPVMTVRIEAKSTQDSSLGIFDQAEMMLSDIIEAMTGTLYTVPFTLGTGQPFAGGEFEGDVSGASGIVQAVAVTSGTWAGQDAAGTLYFRRRNGVFSAETISITGISGYNSILTIAGENMTGQDAITLASGNLAKRITYKSGGLESYPDPDETIIGQAAEFEIEYAFQQGNPFDN